MTKKRNKKNRDEEASMDVSESQSVSEATPQGSKVNSRLGLVHTRFFICLRFLFDFC